MNSYSVEELCHSIHQANNKDHYVAVVSSNLSEFKLREGIHGLTEIWHSKYLKLFLLNWQNKQRFQSLDHIDDNLDHQGLVLKDSLICTKDSYCTNHHLLCICNLDQSKISWKLRFYLILEENVKRTCFQGILARSSSALSGGIYGNISPKIILIVESSRVRSKVDGPVSLFWTVYFYILGPSRFIFRSYTLFPRPSMDASTFWFQYRPVWYMTVQF